MCASSPRSDSAGSAVARWMRLLARRFRLRSSSAVRNGVAISASPRAQRGGGRRRASANTGMRHHRADHLALGFVFFPSS